MTEQLSTDRSTIGYPIHIIHIYVASFSLNIGALVSFLARRTGTEFSQEIGKAIGE
jgi:hypothetical protein